MGNGVNLRPRTVVIISPYAHNAGHHWAFSKNLARGLKRQGASVKIIVSARPIEPIERDLREVTRRSLPRLPKRLSKSRKSGGAPRWVVSLEHQMETVACLISSTMRYGFKRDVTFHVVDGTFIWLAMWALLLGSRVVLQLWGAPPRTFSADRRILTRAWWLKMVGQSRRVRFVCETEAVRAAWHPILGEHVKVVPYAVMPPNHRPSATEARTRLGIATGARVALLFGTHRESKDYRVVFEAAQLLNPRPHLLFAGKVISENDPRVLSTEYEYDGVTMMCRYLDDKEVADVFAASDVVVLSYGANYTKGSGVLLEAARHDRPVVATTGGHLSEFVLANAIGKVFSPGDARSLSNALKAIFLYQDESPNYFRSCLYRVRRQYSWEQAARQYLNIHRSLYELEQ